MDKKRLKVALAVLDAVKGKFPETKKFINDTMEDECQKEKISTEEVKMQKVSSEKHFLICRDIVLS